MNITRVLSGLVLLTGLSACTSNVVRYEPVLNVNWKLQQQQLSELQSWSIKGRISVQTEYEGGQLDYIWQQYNQNDYDIRLQAPMGAGTTLISAREQGVSLKTSSGDELFDADVDKLIAKLNGWPLPVNGLRYWVKGMPAPGSDYNVSKWNEQGLAEVMLQDGWRIEFKKYNDIKGFVLPGKLFINRQKGEEVDVRLIIRQWQTDSGVAHSTVSRVQVQ
ncbi:MAG TPA: outer membrane lipoprotein LolB [Gammaproteobacteria bacterium]|nr:outer membrane lipoprotein LolB [Gammaproteobacteria bacterium]